MQPTRTSVVRSGESDGLSGVARTVARASCSSTNLDCSFCRSALFSSSVKLRCVHPQQTHPLYRSAHLLRPWSGFPALGGNVPQMDVTHALRTHTPSVRHRLPMESR